MDKTDIIPVKLNGKTYSRWSFHLKYYVEGKGLGGYLDGTTIPQSKEKAKTTEEGTSEPTLVEEKTQVM